MTMRSLIGAVLVMQLAGVHSAFASGLSDSIERAAERAASQPAAATRGGSSGMVAFGASLIGLVERSPCLRLRPMRTKSPPATRAGARRRTR